MTLTGADPMKRKHAEKAVRRREAEEVLQNPPETVDKEALKAEMDDILDEIDLVLEENAQEFVEAYVQRGGE